MRGAKEVAATGALAALYCVTGLLVIPFPAMPLTLQCFAVALGAYSFGARAALSAVAVYTAVGAVGLPVFAGAQGGAQVVLGPTGGFIWGFFLLSLCCGLGGERMRALLLGLLGLGLCYTAGVLQYAFVTGVGLWGAFISCGAPYILKDVLLTGLAYFLSVKIKKELKKLPFQS